MDNQELDPRQFSSFAHYLTSLTITFFANCCIAVLLHVLGYGKSFSWTLLFSHTMGFSICSCIHLALYIVRPSRYSFVYPTIGVGLVGGTLAAIGLLKTFTDIPFDFSLFWQSIFLGLSFGAVISLFFIIRKKLALTRSELQEEQIKALENEKNALQTRLKLLQAQIEPHFLFNTLANIEGLLASDVKTAGTMLSNLTFYLRASLKKTRNTSITLQEELKMVRAYLDIFRIRMGERLCYKIEVEDGLEGISVPAMLIQPLVENSILHGLEPKPEGGEIIISAKRADGRLRLEVADTGSGLGSNEQQGLGLANVRERLGLYYSGDATMRVEENQPTGLQVIMEVPCM